MARPGDPLRPRRLPLAGPWATVPALAVLGTLLVVALAYSLAQSLGALPLTGEADVGLDAYRSLVSGEAGSGDLLVSAAFTLWVSTASTILAATVALAAVAWLDGPRRGRLASGLLHLNLAIPHVVWAVALLLLLSQSGIVARGTAAVGLLDDPAGFPILVRDRYGIGVILHYAAKEAPFLALVGLALLRSRPRELGLMADTLGASGLRRVRLVTVPTVLPGMALASALVFAFVFGAYEAPVVLGASSPRALSVVGIDLFNAADLTRRPVAMALGVLMTIGVATILWAVWVIARRRR